MKWAYMMILAWLCATGTAYAWPGVVLDVHDGDTVRVAPGGDVETPVTVRLYGLDAPELEQPGGAEAAVRLRELLPEGSVVEIIPYGVDAYGRALGLVQTSGRTVNPVLVSDGLAWVYERYCKAAFCRKWLKAQGAARDRKQGLWSGEAVPPWEWRRKKH